jgi:hypothetical protein
MGVERFNLILDVLALDLEEFGVVGGCRDDSAIDGDVCGDGVSRRGVDVEGEKILVAVDGLVVMCGKDLGGWKFVSYL